MQRLGEAVRSGTPTTVKVTLPSPLFSHESFGYSCRGRGLGAWALGLGATRNSTPTVKLVRHTHCDSHCDPATKLCDLYDHPATKLYDAEGWLTVPRAPRS